jgi:hypothetical protein
MFAIKTFPEGIERTSSDIAIDDPETSQAEEAQPPFTVSRMVRGIGGGGLRRGVV